MNNKAHLRPQDYDSNGDIIPMACKEEKGDLISREALKMALKEYKYCGFYDKVIEIIDNAPTVKSCDNCDLYFKAMTKQEEKNNED